MSVSLSNRVCDNLRIDETSVHTIICIGSGTHSAAHAIFHAPIRGYDGVGTVLSILFPRSQFGLKRVSVLC